MWKVVLSYPYYLKIFVPKKYTESGNRTFLRLEQPPKALVSILLAVGIIVTDSRLVHRSKAPYGTPGSPGYSVRAFALVKYFNSLKDVISKFSLILV